MVWGEPSIAGPMALPENFSMTLTSALMTLQMSPCQVDRATRADPTDEWRPIFRQCPTSPQTQSAITTWRWRHATWQLNKKLRYREEHSASVMLSWCTLWHFSWENLLMANQPLLLNWPRKHTEFGEIRQNNGHYAVQGHSRSPILVPVESPYATSYYY